MFRPVSSLVANRNTGLGATERHHANGGTCTDGAARLESGSVEWTFIYLMIGLKIPIVMLGYIVWRAIKDVPDPEESTQPGSGDGGTRTRPHPRRPIPGPPRRGPHGEPALPAPPRTRTVVAKARHTDQQS